MDVRLVSHASVVVKTGDAVIWSDPWLAGTAFNDSWRLLPDAIALSDDDYEEISHLWISHEHPDHLHVPTLRGLPDSFKRRATVLIQKTNSPKIPNALASMGFEHIELLAHRRTTRVTPETSVYCYQVGQMDSVLGVLHHDERLININDAELSPSDCRLITGDLGSGFDVALNQFSLAGYGGRTDRDRRLREAADQILQNVVDNQRELGARVTIPFASLVYFCCRDNQYMNRYANTPSDVFDRLERERLGCVPLWPGESYDTRAPHDPRSTIERYRALRRTIPDLQYDEPPLRTLEEVRAAFHLRRTQLLERYPRWVLRLCGPVTVFLPDLDLTVELALSDGRFEARPGDDQADLEVFAQPLWFAFATPWGIQTLGVSARLVVRKNYRRWRAYRVLTSMNNAEVWLRPTHLLSRANLDHVRSRWSGGLRQLLSKYRRGAR